MKHLLALCLAAIIIAPAHAQEEMFTGKIFTAQGVVEVQKAGATEWTAIKAPINIEVNDKVRTGPGSTAEIYVKNGAKVRLTSGTTFVLTANTAEGSTMEVMVGKMQAWFRKTGRRFNVRTPSAVCAIRGTVLEVEVASGGETVWNLFSGSIQVSNPDNTVTRDVQPNQRVVVTAAAVISEPEVLPIEVKAPEEPKKIKEEKAEIKAEEKAAKEAKKAEDKAAKEAAKEADAKAKAEAEAKAEADAAAGEVTPEAPPVDDTVVIPPAPVEPPSVIPSQELSTSGG